MKFLRSSRGRSVAGLVGVAVAALLVPFGSPARASTATSDRPSDDHHNSLSRAELARVLQDEGLPTLKALPITAKSHPFDGAAWQTKPLDLAKYGYTEKEYLMSGRANVYNWQPSGGYKTTITANGPYTTQVDVRLPKDMRTWSGKVNLEISNMSSGYNFAAIWSALWETTLNDHDIYVGVTSKPNVIPGMQRFDPQRYGALSWKNPVAPDQQACGTLPSDAGYNANLSKLYENGLAWDIFSQLGRLLKSKSSQNPLGRPASQVVLTGESQSSGYLLTYYRYFTPSAVFPNGKPIFDGYFAETQVGLAGAPIQQCAQPLSVSDPQRAVFPNRAVPWIGVNSQWDYPGARKWVAPVDANTDLAKHVFWQLAGSNHGWEWQYLYGDASAADLLKAGFDDPSTYDWSCGRNNPEVPLYMAEKAGFEELKTWIRTNRSPSHAPRILTKTVTPGDGFDDQTVYDAQNNAMGGLRFPMVDVPVASFGVGRYALTDGCPEIVPFDAATLSSLYPTRQYYLNHYDRATDALVQDGFILKPDAAKLKATARRVTSVVDSTDE